MTVDLWPWLAVAGMGALHGLNPATGWGVAAAWSLRTGDRRRAWRALLPIAAGHAASVALVAGAVALGLSMRRDLLVAGAILGVAGIVVARLCGRLGRTSAPAAHGALALWSFAMATAHGAGLMLVPALAPLCLGSAAGGASSSATAPLALALGAVAVHAAAMLATTGAVASGAGRLTPRRWRAPRPAA